MDIEMEGVKQDRMKQYLLPEKEQNYNNPIIVYVVLCLD
jgi:hypothetical protein